jgi:hypothetical protein
LKTIYDRNRVSIEIDFFSSQASQQFFDKKNTQYFLAKRFSQNCFKFSIFFSKKNCQPFFAKQTKNSEEMSNYVFSPPQKCVFAK